MGDIGSVGGKFPGIGNDIAAAAAAQDSGDVKKQTEQAQERTGIGLADIPDTPAPDIEESEQQVQQSQSEENISEVVDQDAEDLLDQIEGTIKEIQERLKESTAKKIKYAADPKNDEKKKPLLKSAYNDIKHVYAELENIKKMLS